MTKRSGAYGPEYASLYYQFYSAKPYSEQARFISRRLEEAGILPGARVLDLACGTGGHALELAALGYAAVGVDIAESMLEEARRKASVRGLAVEFLCQDLQELEVGESVFDAAVCLFDSLGYLVTDANISEALSRVNRALRPGGIFAVEVWHRPAVLRAYDKIRVLRLGPPGREILRLSETELEVDSQTAVVTYTVFRQAPDGRWDCFGEEHRNRFFPRRDLAKLLRQAGLVPFRWSAGYGDGPITAQTWHLVAICEKKEGTS